MSLLFLGLLLVGICLTQPWGPGTHLEFACRVYRNRRKFVTPPVAELLRTERNAYDYGNIAADVISLKGWGGHKNHCHRWTIVGDMQKLAETPAEEAFALGYLSHLAADTIAHNHFVPYHLARYSRSKGLGHLYWEMRADRFVKEERWERVTRLKGDETLFSLDELIHRTVPKKALSMRTNKLVFNHVLLISERDQWRRGIERLHELSWAPLEHDFLERFHHAAIGRIRLALSPHGLEQLMHLDTTGKAAQRSAWKARRSLLNRLGSGARRRAMAAAAAEPYLLGMQSPPDVGDDPATPHW